MYVVSDHEQIPHTEISSVEYGLMAVSETIFPANLVTDAKHRAFSTNHLASINKTTVSMITTKNYTENLNYHASRLPTTMCIN